MARKTGPCELCHEENGLLVMRADRWLCGDCVRGWDYYGSMTPEERRADEEAIARYVSEGDGL